MESLTPREWAYWCTSEKLDPGGGMYECASLVATQIINSIRALASGFSQQPIEEEDMLPPDAFVPGRDHRGRERAETEEALRALETMRGI